jgi:hypothetical protein
LNYSDEMNRAYQYAYAKNITTMDSIDKADMWWPLTRIAMAKMLSWYAINELWMKPDTTRQTVFSDVSDELDAQYNSWVILAYQLWIMWINMPDERFRPFDYVPRAEFVTALWRMKYWIKDWEDVYFSTHMNLLEDLWIISNTNPDMIELRWYVMIMLMRTAMNQNVWENIDSIWDDVVQNYFNQPYEKWDWYSKIWDLQDMLIYYWYYAWKKNYRYDKNTIEAVYRFQIDMWILDKNDINNPARWWMWPETRNALNKKWAEYNVVE